MAGKLKRAERKLEECEDTECNFRSPINGTCGYGLRHIGCHQTDPGMKEIEKAMLEGYSWQKSRK